MHTIKTLESVKELFKTDGRPELSEADKTRIREIWRRQVSPSARLDYNNYFKTLVPAEQDRIKKFWGL